MRQPNASPSPSSRQPGRSFDDPSKPLGQDLLERSRRSETVPEDMRDRAEQAASTAGGVAERAKVVSVLRKLDELVAEDNLPMTAKGDVQRALELACGRVGLTYPEYRALADNDPELLELEAKILADARRRIR